MTLAASLAGCVTAPRPLEPKSTSVFPLGVYWPGEYTYQDAGDTEKRWQRVEATLDRLAHDGINTVWLTHLPAGDTARFARLADARGIRLVAAIAELAGNVPDVRKGDVHRLRDQTLAAWGDAPPPLAWGLGDEPRTAAMEEMIPHVTAWRAAGQPTAIVLMPADLAAGARLLPLRYLCADVYPFFSSGNPNGPNQHAASVGYFIQAARRTVDLAAQHGLQPWIMAQSFQEPWGAFDFDAAGNVIYLPGGGPHWRMPTPAEVRWQTWAAVATGARGVFHFSLHLGMRRPAKVQPLPPDSPIAVRVETPTGLPAGMLYLDGQPTRVYEAMAESYRQIQQVARYLVAMRPSRDTFAFLAKGSPEPGTLATCFRDPGGHAFVIVVNGNVYAAEEVAVNVEREFTVAYDLVARRPVDLLDREVKAYEPIGPFRQARLRLEPGGGTVLQLQ